MPIRSLRATSSRLARKVLLALALGLAGVTACAGDGPEPAPITVCEPTTSAFVGEATYYVEADGSGNCSFPATPNDLLVGAMNQRDYDGSAACGACAAIDGPNGSVTVRIVDRCPECRSGDIDLSPEAFDRLAARSAGRVPITWRYVPCDVSGGLVFQFKEGSNAWWTAVQIRNHRTPIATLEARGADGAFHAIPRLEYDYFVAAHGLGPGPYTFRVTDVEGQVIEEPDVPLSDGGSVSRQGQFPGCAP